MIVESDLSMYDRPVLGGTPRQKGGGGERETRCRLTPVVRPLRHCASPRLRLDHRHKEDMRKEKEKRNNRNMTGALERGSPFRGPFCYQGGILIVINNTETVPLPIRSISFRILDLQLAVLYSLFRSTDRVEKDHCRILHIETLCEM